MAIQTVSITGTVRNLDATLYKGAIIEVYLSKQGNIDGNVIGNEPQRTFSNAYGKFHLTLIPTDLMEPGTHYQFKIVKENINWYKKVVPANITFAPFEGLTSFVPETRRLPLLGGLHRDVNLNPVKQLVFSQTNLLFHPVEADGVQTVFGAPGAVTLVGRNGVIQNEIGDYIKLNVNTIEFVEPPLAGDIVILQYKAG